MLMFRVVLIAGLVSLQTFCGVTMVVGKTVEMPVYSDWRGDNCQFKSERPFFLIKDLDDLEKFWQKANTGEATPAIDFERFMLLVWAPGSSLFDHRPVMVERLLCKDDKYIVLMNFKRKDTGGFWRRPFVATLLPMIKNGDIFIMSKHEKGPEKVEWKPLYTIWDMSTQRQRPFEVAQLDPVAEKPAFIEHGKAPQPEPTEFAAARVVTTPTAAAASTTAAVNTVAAVEPAVTSSTASAGSSIQSVKPVQAAAAQKEPDAGNTEAMFPEENPFGTSSAAKTESAPAQVKPVAPVNPTFEEDPLFGTEFDITF